MSDATSFNPHKEEDEGYLAAEAGQGLTANLYPCGTIRHEHWRRGWRIKTDEIQRTIKLGSGMGQEDEGYLAAEAGQAATANPYPYGTIRYEDWRRGWHIKTEETQRAIRLDRATRI
ncbi:MAG: hypothetical protein QOH05_4520 [Acetobacteraceae bacterium]|jgi:hypothetical protein|nr:hypothetical protein [Acetobacteraceae bacterium]